MFDCVTHGRFQCDYVFQVFFQSFTNSSVRVGGEDCFGFVCLFDSHLLCSKLAFVSDEFSVLLLLRQVAMSSGAKVFLSMISSST